MNRMWVLLALIAGGSALLTTSCSSREHRRVPAPDREWVTLDAYRTRDRGRPSPVVEIPAGTELRFQFTREPSPTPFWTTKVGEDNPFEAVGMPAFSVKCRRPCYLDLERMTVSIDKEQWWELAQVIFPDWMSMDFSLVPEGKDPLSRPVNAYVYVAMGWPRMTR